MNLKDRITEDMKAAMRAKDSQRLGTIRLLLAACKQREVDERVVLDDPAVVAIIDKLIKQRKDSIAAYEKAQRADLAAVEAFEMAVLETYLPKRLSQQEVGAAVANLVADIANELGRKPGPADMGKLMAAAKGQLAGNADMGQVSAALKAQLAG